MAMAAVARAVGRAAAVKGVAREGVTVRVVAVGEVPFLEAKARASAVEARASAVEARAREAAEVGWGTGRCPEEEARAREAAVMAPEALAQAAGAAEKGPAGPAIP